MNKGGEESFMNDQITSTGATKCPNVYLKRGKGKGKRIKVSIIPTAIRHRQRH